MPPTIITVFSPPGERHPGGCAPGISAGGILENQRGRRVAGMSALRSRWFIPFEVWKLVCLPWYSAGRRIREKSGTCLPPP